tara:strand:- start:9214 stop:9603 length:390 start_codon:yes stop_codon:yes gene_type:complete
MLKTIMACACCGSTDVRADAWAEWSNHLSKWVLHFTYDNKWCEACEAEATLREIEVIWNGSIPFYDAAEHYSGLAITGEGDGWTIFTVEKGTGKHEAIYQTDTNEDATSAASILSSELSLPMQHSIAAE